MLKEKVTKFKEKAKTYLCGAKGLFDVFREKNSIKDLDGNVLYEGRGTIQRILEKAVKEGVALPRADLRNQKFAALKIPNAKLRGASFEGSPITTYRPYNVDYVSDLSGADLREVSFDKIDKETKLAGSDVEKADFNGHKLSSTLHIIKQENPITKKSNTYYIPSITYVKNFDKAYNVKESSLNDWNEGHKKLAEYEAKEKEYYEDKTVNPKPSAINVSSLKSDQSR